MPLGGGILETLGALIMLQVVARILPRVVGPSQLDREHFQQRERHHKEGLAFRTEERNQHKARTEIQFRRELQTREEEQKFRRDMLDQEQSFDFWPLNIAPRSFIAIGNQKPVTPLVMFVIPPRLSGGETNNPFTETCEDAISKVMNAAYNANDHERPVVFLDGGGWKEGRGRATTALRNLYHYAPNVPVAVIEIDLINQGLHLKVGCYGFAPIGIDTKPAMSDSREIALSCFAREDSERLNKLLVKQNAEYASQGLEVELVNLRTFAMEDMFGVTFDEHYSLDPRHIRKGINSLGLALQLTASGLADIFHFLRHGVSPALPNLLPNLLDKVADTAKNEIAHGVFDNYQTMYRLQVKAQPHRAAKLLFDLATALQRAQAKNFSVCSSPVDLYNEAMDVVKAKHRVSGNVSMGIIINLLKENGEFELLKSMQHALEAFGEDTHATLVREIILEAHSYELSKTGPLWRI